MQSLTFESRMPRHVMSRRHIPSHPVMSCHVRLPHHSRSCLCLAKSIYDQIKYNSKTIEIKTKYNKIQPKWIGMGKEERRKEVEGGMIHFLWPVAFDLRRALLLSPPSRTICLWNK